MVSIKPIKNNPIIELMDKVWVNKTPFYCQQISDSFYRGSEPSEKEMKMLAEKGVKKILNLKSVTKKELAALTEQAKKNGLEYINIPLNPFHIKNTFPYIIEAIESATKENPLFIHCTFGRDRTGFVSALVKYTKQGLPMPDAIKDMEAHGFRKTLFFNVENFLKKFDSAMKGCSRTAMQ
ncbi:MAG: tyrosine-protein phosphatase [Candidatus Gastranaerophilales bacterium]|nr:tyrosine-protein phosphatase [Candidatus Gastranaerophilales bacterium]